VEARCKRPGNQGDAKVSHPAEVRILTVVIILYIDSYRREDYQAYNRLCGSIRGLAHKLSKLADQDPFKAKYQGMLLSKLYDMGILDVTAKITDVESKVTVSSLCRRRLAVVMVRLKMCETVSKVGARLC
jgi:U3 small nucleolar ribonucleoprotein protein IMP3